MKTGLKILLGVAAVFGIGALASKKNKPTEDAPKELPKNTGKNIKSILFVGDSNTYYPWSYANQFMAKYPSIKAKKISKIGAKTDWMIGELKKELLVNKYDVVCVLGGSNDIYGGSTVEKSISNLSSMFGMIKKSGALSIGITPPSKDYFTRRKANLNEMLEDLLNWYLSGFAFKSGLGRWINFKQITSNKKYFSSKDGFLHPQKEAHTVLLNEVVKNINQYYGTKL